MKKFGVLFAVATLAIASVAAQAQTINQRLENQHDRIHQGVKSGQLTRKEANVVRTDDRLIHSEEKLDRSRDKGKLTAGEKKSLNNQLNRNSARIYKLKHNGITRG